MSKEVPDNGVVKCLRTEEDTVRTDSPNSVEYIPQQCFVKRVGVLGNGATQISAVAVPRSRIREDFPELDILGCDTIHFDPLPRLAADEMISGNYSIGPRHKAGYGLTRRGSA